MKEREITPRILCSFERYLREDEKSDATVMKYLHDVSCFAKFASGRAVDKSLTRDYKAFLK